MKKSRFMKTQILSILKQQEYCRTTKKLARQNRVSYATIYNWKSKYGGMEDSDVKRRLKDLEVDDLR